MPPSSFAAGASGSGERRRDPWVLFADPGAAGGDGDAGAEAEADVVVEHLPPPPPPPAAVDRAVATARAMASGGRWAILDRAPRVAHPRDMLASGDADVVLDIVEPPAISTATVSRALLPDADADAWGACRVEGVDASGRLLLALPSPRAPGESNLLVCTPLPTSSVAAAKAHGKATFIPAFPEEELGGLAISPSAPTGILQDHRSSDAYHVVRLQPPSSRPGVAAALCFSSVDGVWSVKEVPGGSGFHARSVVSHDRGVRGEGRLLFVDYVARSVLLFHPLLTSWDLVPFPVVAEEGVVSGGARGGGGGAMMDACVDSSQGKVVCLIFYEVEEGGTMIGMWSLQEGGGEELRWSPHFEVASDEVFACNHELLPLRGVERIGPVHPHMMTRVFFTVGGPGDASSSSFCVKVTPANLVLRRVELFGRIEQRDAAACLEFVVCPLRDAARGSLMQSVNSTLKEAKEMALTAVREGSEYAVREGTQAARLTLTAVDKGRKHADKLPGAVQLVGGALSLPHTAALLTAANVLKTVNDSLTVAETASSWLRQHGPGAPGTDYRVAGNLREALDLTDEWIHLGKPTTMLVDPANHLTTQQWQDIRAAMVQRGGGYLVQHYDYEMVERPPR